MFRSRARPVVFPQAEHARLAGAIALEWAERPDVPWDSFVAGVALHDRGYGELDAEDLDTVGDDRWLDIQRRGLEPRRADPVTDLVVGLHIRRLVSHGGDTREFDPLLRRLRDAAGLDEETASEADRITATCDRIAFDFCLEEPSSGESNGIAFELDGRGSIVLDPWPLAVPRLSGLLLAFEADGYPERLAPVVVSYSVAPRYAAA